MFPSSHLNALLSTKALYLERKILPVLRELLADDTLASQQDRARNKLA